MIWFEFTLGLFGPFQSDVCVDVYLVDQHARGHGEARPGGEVTGDHDPHAGLAEGHLVGVRTQQLVHHQHRRLRVEVDWRETTHTHTHNHTTTHHQLTAELIVYFLIQLEAQLDISQKYQYIVLLFKERNCCFPLVSL